MKVGLYASMFGSTPEQFPDIESFIEYAYELRLDVIDLRSDVGFHSHDTGYLMETKMRCLERGLSIGYLASGGHFFGTDAELEEKLERVAADVRAAALLGAPMIRLFCGQPLTDPEEQEREVRCLQRACDMAAERGVAVGLQNHPSTGDDVLRLMEQTQRRNFTFLLDTGQWVGSPARNQGVPEPGYDIYRFMEQTAAHAGHVRAKFYKIDSGAEEWLDYPRIFRILRDAGYNGTMSVVFEGKDVNSCDDRGVLRLAAEQLRSLASP